MTLKETVKLLPKPYILSHDIGGIGDVDIADPTKPLEVLIGPIDMNQKDRLDLFWGNNQNPVYTYTHSPDAPNTNGFFSLYVSTQWIEPGATIVSYSYTPFPSNTPEMSDTTEVLVKLSIPGGRDPDPSSPYQNEGLLKPSVLPPGIIISPEGVTATIKPYLNMAVGDKITLSWNGEFVTQSVESADQIDKPVIIAVPRQIIEAAGDSDMLEVRYEIRDLVNNWSRWSLPTYTEVEAGNSNLPAPVAPQAPNFVLDLDKLAGSPIQVLVVADPQITEGDEITLVIDRYTAEGMALEPYTETKLAENPSSFVEFQLPFVQFVPITQGRARLKYTATKPSGARLRSKSLSLTVIGEAQHLLPPTVPAADNATLDPASRDVTALVPPYYFMADGNNVRLVWAGKTANGATVLHEELRTLNRDDIDKVLEYHIPQDKVSVLAGGTVQVFYTVTTFTRAFFKSPVLDLTVSHDSTIELPAATVDHLSADGILDPADIGPEAKVRIQPYKGMAIRDKVTLRWDSQAPAGDFTTHTVINSGTVNHEVVFRVQKDIVLGSLNASVNVWYDVERGAQKYTSKKLVLLVEAATVTPLPNPAIKESKGDTLSVSDIPNGATFLVDTDAKLEMNDLVLMHITGPNGGDSKEKMITQADAGRKLSVVFSKVIIETNVGQTLQVQYDVRRASGIVQKSNTVELKVIAPPIPLPAPHMDTVGPDGILNPSNIPESGATVRVRYDGMSTGDSVLVNWQGASAYQTPAQLVGANVELLFNVPKAFINQSIGGSASVTYTVTRAGTALPSAPLYMRVSQGLTLDATPVTLSGKVYLIPSSPDLLPAFPAGTTVKRTASGGQAPYSYRSSDTKVAQVDADGLASVRGNGTATISVTDAVGNTASYPVTVTGVVHCIGLGSGKYSQINSAAVGHGLRLPSIDELNQIFHAYGSRWPMGNAWYWSSTVAAQNLVGMKWYLNKNLVTGANFKVFEHDGALGVGLR